MHNKSYSAGTASLFRTAQWRHLEQQRHDDVNARDGIVSCQRAGLCHDHNLEQQEEGFACSSTDPKHAVESED